MKSRLFMQLHRANETEPLHLVNAAGLLPHTDRTAARRELPQGAHPDLVILAPESLVGRSPSRKERSVVLRIRLEERTQRGVQIIMEPRLRLRALQVPAGFINLER